MERINSVSWRFSPKRASSYFRFPSPTKFLNLIEFSFLSPFQAACEKSSQATKHAGSIFPSLGLAARQGAPDHAPRLPRAGAGGPHDRGGAAVHPQSAQSQALHPHQEDFQQSHRSYPVPPQAPAQRQLRVRLSPVRVLFLRHSHVLSVSSREYFFTHPTIETEEKTTGSHQKVKRNGRFKLWLLRNSKGIWASVYRKKKNDPGKIIGMIPSGCFIHHNFYYHCMCGEEKNGKEWGERRFTMSRSIDRLIDWLAAVCWWLFCCCTFWACRATECSPPPPFAMRCIGLIFIMMVFFIPGCAFIHKQNIFTSGSEFFCTILEFGARMEKKMCARVQQGLADSISSYFGGGWCFFFFTGPDKKWMKIGQHKRRKFFFTKWCPLVETFLFLLRREFCAKAFWCGAARCFGLALFRLFLISLSGINFTVYVFSLDLVSYL